MESRVKVRDEGQMIRRLRSDAVFSQFIPFWSLFSKNSKSPLHKCKVENEGQARLELNLLFIDKLGDGLKVKMQKNWGGYLEKWGNELRSEIYEAGSEVIFVASDLEVWGDFFWSM